MAVAACFFPRWPDSGRQYRHASERSNRLLSIAQQEDTREYVARAYLLSGMAKASISTSHQAESDFKKALEISNEVRLQEISYKAHLRVGILYIRLAEIEGRNLLISAQRELSQAREILKRIPSQIKEPTARQLFLNYRLQKVVSPERLCAARG